MRVSDVDRHAQRVDTHTSIASIACERAKNSRALSHPRIVFFDTHRAARTSSRTTMLNAREARARVRDAHVRNIVRCCKPA